MGSKRNVYLEMKPLADAREYFLARFDWAAALTGEKVPVADAVGRPLAEPVYARLSAPTYHGSAMDGIAVREMDDLVVLLSERSVGQKVTLAVIRGDDERNVEVTLEERPAR